MPQSYLLLAATFMPLLLAPVSYVLARRFGANVTTWFSFGVLAVSTALLFVAATALNGAQSVYSESYPWSQFGNFGLRLDGLSLPFALIIYILCTALALYSKPYMIHKISEDAPEHFKANGGITAGSGAPSNSNDDYTSKHIDIDSRSSQTTAIVEKKQYLNSQMGLYFALYMTFSMGMLGTVLATNLIEFYVFFELMLVPSFFLIAFYGYGARRRIALMFFFWTHTGAVVLLLGLLAMGFFAGGFDYSTVKANVSHIPAQWISFIVFALVLGLGVKLHISFAYLVALCSLRSTYPYFGLTLSSDDRYRRIRVATPMVGTANWKLCSIQSLYQHLGSGHNDIRWRYGPHAR